MRQLLSMRDGFGEALVELGRRNPNVVALDADLASATKLSAFAAEFPERFFQIGIAEQNMACVAAGLATLGFTPFIASFATFVSSRIADQVRTSIAQPRLSVKIIGPYSGLMTGRTGKTHQAIEDIALYRGMPDIAVVAPADSIETGQAVAAIADYPGPVYLRLTRDPAPVLFDASHIFRVGEAYLLRQGRSVTLISTGGMLPTTLDAAELLSAEDLDATVLHVPTIKPLDVEAVVAAARTSGRVITVEEHNICGGLGAAITETLSETYPVPVHRVGIQDTFGESGPNEPLMEKYGLTVQSIAAAARAWVARWPEAQHV